MPSGTPLPDAAALEQTVQQYQAELLRYASGILGNRADAEDAVQTAFLKAWRNRGRLRPDTRLRPLLYRITYRTALDMLRAAKRPDDVEPAVSAASDPDLQLDVQLSLIHI